MKKKNALFICIMCIALLFSGCTAEKADESKTLLTNETDVVNGEVKSHLSGEVFKEPPGLSLVWSTGIADVSRGTYSWNYTTWNGNWTGICADSLHPLQSEDYIQPVYLNETTVSLSFESDPDKLKLCCWSDSEWENTQAESENVEFNGVDLELKKGGYIYLISAEWFDDGGDFYGTADYYFYAVVE